MKLTNFVVASVAAASLTGCAMAAAPVNGLFYSNVKSSGLATDAYGGTAHGEACATSILGVYASGDASIETAKKNGGVAQVVSVDHTAESILGVFAKYCTHVYGKRGANPPAAAAKSSEG